jgi:hypothetical protein
MSDSHPLRPAVQVQMRADGALVYLIDRPPEALPPVRPRDLEAAWDAARRAALADRWGTARFFRFLRRDGSCTDLALADPDACCWAGAVDATTGIASSYGMSLCLRLLALVDVMASVPWAADHFALRRDGADIAPPMLAAAATLPLTAEGGFDPADMHACLATSRLASPFAAKRTAALPRGATG